MKYTTAAKLNQEGSLVKKSWTNLWKVKEPFEWKIYYDKPREYNIIQVPEWFETDMGSIPQCFWWLFNPTKYVAYILHDFLYHKKGKIETKYGIVTHVFMFKRKRCDQILLEALKAEKCSFIKRWLIYLGVRIGGWVAWKNN